MATTASFSPVRARRTAAWPIVTTCPGLDLRRRDDAVGIGDEGRIGQGVAGQRQGAFATDQAAARFFRRRLLPIVARRRRPAFAAQRRDALQLRLRLRQRGAGRPDLGVGLLLLEPQVGFIEGREGLAGFDPVADLHQAARHLAGDAEAEIALDPGTDGADERPFRNMRGEGDARDQHRTLRSGLRLGCLVLAGGERRGQHQRGEGEVLAHREPLPIELYQLMKNNIRQ